MTTMPINCRVNVDTVMQDKLDALNQVDKRFCDGLAKQFLDQTINFSPDVSKDFLHVYSYLFVFFRILFFFSKIRLVRHDKTNKQEHKNKFTNSTERTNRQN